MFDPHVGFDFFPRSHLPACGNVAERCTRFHPTNLLVNLCQRDVGLCNNFFPGEASPINGQRGDILIIPSLSASLVFKFMVYSLNGIQ